ncbi:sulfite exporter TauE/SafE family protein [Dongia sp.]|uniref:sulfite exporter TauE/SafE family protein n=1 Tax=Dongia sp. TaxID=1977262 RepID=UPI0035B43CA6
MPAALLNLMPAMSAGAALLVFGTVFLAGFLRGFTGFGFALAAVPVITLFLEPAAIVPAIPIVAMVAGAEQLRRAWGQANWPAIRRLLIGAIIGAPFGVAALTYLPANVMRIIIGGVLLAAVLLLWRGYRFKKTPPTSAQLGIGVFSGLLNGATAMGGPPVILFFLAAPEGVAVGRASLLIYFFFISAWSIVMQSVGGLMDLKVVVLALLMIPVMALGNVIGDRMFDRSSATTYQRVALLFLLAIAVVAILRAFMAP